MTTLNINLSVKYWLALAIAGIIGIVIPSTARGEIPVTGGRTAGDAAFFVPDTGNTLLFDTNTQLIRLETPNGITVNSQFRPRSGRLDPFTGIPVGGETGRLEGTLSGRAFTAEGTPFFFQGVSTTLNFTLTSFDSDRVFEGTLISPTGKTATPLVFLEATDASLSDEASDNFAALSGELHIGEFSANLPGGSIDLPADTQFAGSAIEFINFENDTLAANANTKFNLVGNGEGTTNLDASQGTVSYESDNGVTDFTIQGTVEGTPDNSNGRASDRIASETSNSESDIIVDDNSFKIEGTISGPTNVFVGGVDPSSLDGDRTYTGNTQYQVSGIGRGSTEFDSKEGSLNFSSPESNTEVEITGDGFAYQGTATGEVSFNLGVGLSSTPDPTSTSNGRVLGIDPAPISTDFGRGFSGLRPLPRGVDTPDNNVVLDNQTILDNVSTSETDNGSSATETEEPRIALPTGPLPDSPEATTPQPQPEVTTPQPQPEVTTPQPQPEVTTPQPQPEATTPQPQPEATTPQPEVTTPQPQPEVTTPQPEATVRQDSLADLIEQIRQQRSQSDQEDAPGFSEAVELHLMRLSNPTPRSRVFPGLENMR